MQEVLKQFVSQGVCYMKLNGWQRLWMVISIPWSAYWLLLFIVGLQKSGIRFWQVESPIFVALIVFPPLLLYIAGLAIRWVIRGFKSN